jgi:hypothetical protein
MSAAPQIDFGDPRGLADLGTYLARASRANPDGAVRLQVLGNLLVTTVAVIEGTGLLGEGTVLGMRVVTIAPSDAVDATVSFASVSDRLARDGAGSVLSVPLRDRGSRRSPRARRRMPAVTLSSRSGGARGGR